MNNVGNVCRANHFKVEEEVVLSGGAVSKSREVGLESRIEDFLSENLGRVLIRAGKSKSLSRWKRREKAEKANLI